MSNIISKQAEIEPEAISKWKKEFREYVDSLDIARDDWKGIIEYIDELPYAQPEIIVLCVDCIKRDKCKFYDTQGDGGYCRYGRDKDGRFNPQTGC